MAAQHAGVFSTELQEKIQSSKILVVGAGGIGCEILKNLVLSGFKEIEIIDLDTIDVSNLNRQFLFHKEHVGKSKAVVAKESALSFNPNVNIKAYHDSITSTSYGVNFFKQFNIVLNALDNRQARNHVNRMCLNANVPLVESGTAGYNGQVELIKKGLTQCYECTPKATQKSYPGCTIRNTPSEPIHCIVWAKHLFNQLFGESNDDEDVSPDSADPEAAGDVSTDDLSKNTNDKGNIERVNTRQWAKSTNYNVEKIFNKLFYDDIKYLLRMANLWKNRQPPQPIKWNEFFTFDVGGNNTTSNRFLLADQIVWSLAECAKIFADSIYVLSTQFEKLTGDDDHLVWDKDDKYAMDFVASCANIRARVFNIAQKSRFDVKSMAGNIIPAIATTNAITAGVVIMHTFKILENKYDECKSVYMRLRPNARNQLFVPDKFLSPPNPKCYVCSEKPTVYLKVDTTKLSVKELKDDVLIKSLNMVEPDVTLDSKGVIVISSEEGETDCNNDKKLSELDICDGAILKVDDFFQQYELSIIVTHSPAEYDQPLFEVIADPADLVPQKKEKSDEGDSNEEDTKESNGSSSKHGHVDDDDDDCEIIEEKKLHMEDDFDDNDGAGGSGLCNQSENIDVDVEVDYSSDDDDVVEIHANLAALKRKQGNEMVDGIIDAKRARVDSISDEDDDVIVLD